ncbi:MAG: alternative ribosome rescue aminoacyl-tRNA hydrolase ArfB [Planctomycetales bacterium]
MEIPPNLQIPDEELRFEYARSGGPGGQNVNKVNSKATLRWQPALNESLPSGVRERFLKRFQSRLTEGGELLIVGQRFRDQPKNVADCLDRLRLMIIEVLQPPKRRIKTRPTGGSVRRRLETKRQNSQKKQGRRGRSLGED